MVQSYREHEQASMLNDWKQTRQICWLIYTSNADTKKAIKNIDKWWPIEENKPKVKVRRNVRKEKALQAKINANLAKLNNGR